RPLRSLLFPYTTLFRSLGTGAFGTVWLEKLVTENGEIQHRAVKEIRKSAQKSKAVDYSRELEAIAKFSHPKVREPVQIRSCPLLDRKSTRLNSSHLGIS